MINPRISADWNTTKPITAFSCTPSVKEVLTKAEVVQITSGLYGLGVIFNCTHRKCIAKHLINSLMGKGAFEHHFITYLNGQRRICAPLLLCYHPAATLQASKVISILWLVEVFPFMNNFSWLFNCESRVYQTRSRLVTLYQYL